jgi:hypothetical protein
VYVHTAKKRILDCIDLSEADAARLTTDPRASCLHVVPMGMINFKNLAVISLPDNTR